MSDQEMCHAKVQVNGDLYDCVCFAGQNHNTSDYDHIVNVDMRVWDADNSGFRRALVTLTWTDE